MSLNISYKDNRQYFVYNGSMYNFECTAAPKINDLWGNSVIRDNEISITVEVSDENKALTFHLNNNILAFSSSVVHIGGMSVSYDNNKYTYVRPEQDSGGAPTYTSAGTYESYKIVTQNELQQFTTNQVIASMSLEDDATLDSSKTTFAFSTAPYVDYSKINLTESTSTATVTYVYYLIKSRNSDENNKYGVILAFKLSVTKAKSADGVVYETTYKDGNLFTYNIDNSACAKYTSCSAIYASQSSGKCQILADYSEFVGIELKTYSKKEIISKTTNFYVAIIQLYNHSSAQNADYELWSTNIDNSRQVSQSNTNTFIEASLNTKVFPWTALNKFITSKDCILIYSTDKGKFLSDTTMLRAINAKSYCTYNVTSHAKRFINKTLTNAYSGFNHCFRLGVLASHFGIIRDIKNLVSGTTSFTALKLYNIPYTEEKQTGINSTVTVFSGMTTGFLIGDTSCVMNTDVASMSLDCRAFEQIDFANNKNLITDAKDIVTQPGTRSSKILRLKINNTSYSWFFIQPFLYIHYTENGTTKSELYYDDTWKLHENVSQTINT